MSGVAADRDVCVGAGMCVLTAPDLFDQDDEGLVVLIDESDPDPALTQRAVLLCPSGALRVTGN
ncbi:ferredoxin [Winogradskya consettensis]|uniref:ferredoxin n=1 Tax=Winogradskya consettensis TaxID=113560 RepID=UPI00245705E9|nr:ferredoxin [Actinoplanes consettensis]